MALSRPGRGRTSDFVTVLPLFSFAFTTIFTSYSLVGFMSSVERVAANGFFLSLYRIPPRRKSTLVIFAKRARLAALLGGHGRDERAVDHDARAGDVEASVAPGTEPVLRRIDGGFGETASSGSESLMRMSLRALFVGWALS